MRPPALSRRLVLAVAQLTPSPAATLLHLLLLLLHLRLRLLPLHLLLLVAGISDSGWGGYWSIHRGSLPGGTGHTTVTATRAGAR